VQNTPLSDSILVPFPVEACLSGVNITAYMDKSPDNYPFKYVLYRTVFDAPASWTPGDGTFINLQFGAVDWNTTVYLNGNYLAGHIGGYDPFNVDLTRSLQVKANELILAIYDPSDEGAQPNGTSTLAL
jgi:beta-galactosidase/beta-glucuronidase